MVKRIDELIKETKQASRHFSLTSTERKNKILSSIAAKIKQRTEDIIEANSIDLKEAKGYSKAFIDRLTLNQKRLSAMEESVREIISLQDPIGKITDQWETPAGLKIKKVVVPLGVIGIIYESRPNVTIEATSLCLKSGNCVILRGGREALNTNRILVNLIKESLLENDFKGEEVNFIDSPERELVYRMIKFADDIDLIIARGGERMINEIRRESTVPVLAHGKGLCHTYIHHDADVQMAVKVCYNAKVQRPGVCNAMETLLIHSEIAEKVLKELIPLYLSAGVELRGCERTRKFSSEIKEANPSDWETEYLDLILSIKIVDSIDEAIEHINTYGSGHSEAIICSDDRIAEKFFNQVDASALFHNASTRLHDGGVFGLGSEIGISTQKIHARGTMGLRELTTTKYIVTGKGHIRE